jgi:uncharacterized protein (DUF3084 family)
MAGRAGHMEGSGNLQLTDALQTQNRYFEMLEREIETEDQELQEQREELDRKGRKLMQNTVDLQEAKAAALQVTDLVKEQNLQLQRQDAKIQQQEQEKQVQLFHNIVKLLFTVMKRF